MVKQIVVSAVDQIQNGQSLEFLKSLLVNPAAANQTHSAALEAFVQTYPQCSIFHLLLAKATQNGEAEIAAKALQSAAVHAANREILFRLIHQPEQITPKQQTVYQSKQALAEKEVLSADASFMPQISGTIEGEIIPVEKPAFAENYPVEIIDTSFKEEKAVPVNEAEIVSEKIPETEIADASFREEKSVSEQLSTQNDASISLNPEEAIAAENDLRVEDVNLNFVNGSAEEIVFPMEEVAAQRPEEEPIIAEAKPETTNTSFAQEIDEEVYDEITAIEDIHFDAVKTVSPKGTPIATEPEKIAVLTIQDKAEKDMLSSIASIDYFTFNNKFGQNQTSPAVAREQSVETKSVLADQKALPAKAETLAVEKEPETVSKYHDEKMPYTFMWWLDKTRKEYAGTYQPYVKNMQVQKPETGLSVGPELHQQYIESIFHAKPPHGLTEESIPPVIEPPAKRKEDQLIERFIIQEPHIHPPSSDKLDTENKAKKSSEDADILVTETLAKVYLDQMLYHKALDTYQKLLLKFPEKSRYFTSQIELIEKKIN